MHCFIVFPLFLKYLMNAKYMVSSSPVGSKSTLMNPKLINKIQEFSIKLHIGGVIPYFIKSRVIIIQSYAFNLPVQKKNSSYWTNKLNIISSSSLVTKCYLSHKNNIMATFKHFKNTVNSILI